MVNRVLVTTALENTWPTNDKKIIFLGEWCKDYERKQIWEQYDYIIASYHWDDRSKLERDYSILNKLYELILFELVKKLNAIHEVKYSIRYWRIIVGPWLGYFIQILFDRWFSIKNTLASNNIDCAYVVDRKSDNLTPNDFAEFCKLMIEDDWNEMIYTQILFNSNISLNLVEPKKYLKKSKIFKSLKTNIIKYIKAKIINYINKNIQKFSFNDKYFLLKTYLNSKSVFILEIMLGQIPKNWKSNVFQNFNFNKEIRIWEFNLPEFPEFPEFITLLEKLIPLQLPKTYLEGFKIAHQTCTAAFWPQDPKIIFTSNSYSTDDYFKIWAASKIENGTTLIIGQHGGNYGMAKWSFTEDHQIEISDYFLSWGWKDVNQMKIIPFGILKLINQKIAKVDLKSRALMVELVVPRYSYWMYSVPVGAGQWIKYIDDQHKFVSDLRFDIQEKLLIRLNQEDYNLRQANRWQDKFPHIELDNGEIPMAKLLIDTRLYISTYNATTYLESLAMNMPTIIFWNPNHWELREGIQPFFDLLKEVGIYHETPESAAKQINKIWGAIDNWWFDSRTQLARLKFCEKFAHSPEKPLDKLADLFKGLV